MDHPWIGSAKTKLQYAKMQVEDEQKRRREDQSHREQVREEAVGDIQIVLSRHTASKMPAGVLAEFVFDAINSGEIRHAKIEY